MRSNEFLPHPLGGVYGFIGVVPTLFQNPSVYKTGPYSDVPQATAEQKKFLQGTFARFMWGDADKLVPQTQSVRLYIIWYGPGRPK